MNLIDHLLSLLGLERAPKKELYVLEESVNLAVIRAVKVDRRTARKPAPILVRWGLEGDALQEELKTRWGMLSVREQQVVALTCLRYTNQQIGDRLGLGVETVKSYSQHAFGKFGVKRKKEIQGLLAGWDFSDWEGELTDAGRAVGRRGMWRNLR